MDKSKFGFAAHLSEDGRIQTVKDHLEGTARRTSEYAGAFGAADIGYLTGIMHDIGKYSKGFQDRLLCNGPKVDHSTAGAYECINMGQLWPAFAVAGHHAGLPDMGTRADYANTTLMGRIAKARNGNIPDYSYWDAIINMFEYDHSAARGKMAVRELIIFKHESELGNAPAHKLFELVTAKRSGDSPNLPARQYSDYTISVDEDRLPKGVTVERIS